MVKITSLCTSCVQVITNPLCPHCFVTHVSYWLKDQSVSAGTMKKIVEGMIQLITEAEDTPADIDCVACGSKRVNLCTYCFTNRATSILEKNLENEKILSSFKESFGTDIWTMPINH